MAVSRLEGSLVARKPRSINPATQMTAIAAMIPSARRTDFQAFTVRSVFVAGVGVWGSRFENIERQRAALWVEDLVNSFDR